MTFKCSFKRPFKGAFITCIIAFITLKTCAGESRGVSAMSRARRLPECALPKAGVNRVGGGGDTPSSGESAREHRPRRFGNRAFETDSLRSSRRLIAW